MSFSQFSTKADVTKDTKPTETPAVTQPEKKPAEVTPVKKS